MDNENKDLQNETSREEQIREDISAKVAEAAEALQEEIEAVNENAESLADDVTQIDYDAEEVEDAEADEEWVEEAPVKEKKYVHLSLTNFICYMLVCAIVGALLSFAAYKAPSWIDMIPEGSAIATVNGEELTDLDLEYYIYTVAMSKFSELAATDPDATPSNFDWDQETEDGTPLSQVIKEEALDKLIMDKLTLQKGAENGIEWTEEEDSQIQSTVDGFVNQYGEDGFTLRVNSMGIATPKQYAKLYKMVTYLSIISTDVEEDPTAFAPADVDLNEYRREDRATVQHILLKLDTATDETTGVTTATEDPQVLAKAQSVLEQVKSGVDFDQLIEQYNEDDGQPSVGYTFITGEMVPEFEEAALKLNIGETSDIVKSSYGYHIIKRLPGLYELQGYWMETSKINTKDSKIEKISVADIMKRADEASLALSQESVA